MLNYYLHRSSREYSLDTCTHRIAEFVVEFNTVLLSHDWNQMNENQFLFRFYLTSFVVFFLSQRLKNLWSKRFNNLQWLCILYWTNTFDRAMVKWTIGYGNDRLLFSLGLFVFLINFGRSVCIFFVACGLLDRRILSLIIGYYAHWSSDNLH